MNTTIYLVRHGVYVQNGHILPFRKPDVHLSPLGVKQAEKLAELFAGKNIAAVYSSPMERALETAKIIAGNRPVTVDDRLGELRSAFRIEDEGIPDEKSGWEKYTSDWYPKRGGEMPGEIIARMESFLQEKINKHRGQEIIAVSHGDPILFLLAKELHKEPWDIPYIEMGGYRRLTIPGAEVH